MSTHTVSPRDVTLLLQILGGISLLFASITLFDPANIFIATMPLTIAGTGLLLLPYITKFQELMALDIDKNKRKRGGGEGSESRQARRERIRREKKYA